MANKTKTFTNAAMENLTPEAVDVMQSLVWNSCMQHTEKLRQHDFCREITKGSLLESIIINLRDSSIEASGCWEKDINLLTSTGISHFLHTYSVAPGKCWDNASNQSMNFPVHYSHILLLFNAINSKLWTVSLNTPKIHEDIRKNEVKKYRITQNDSHHVIMWWT
jgi:hypothetical protein